MMYKAVLFASMLMLGLEFFPGSIFAESDDNIMTGAEEWLIEPDDYDDDYYDESDLSEDMSFTIIPDDMLKSYIRLLTDNYFTIVDSTTFEKITGRALKKIRNSS